MKHFNQLKYIGLFVALLFINLDINAQLNLPQGSQMASLSQTVGISKIYINYSRPSVNGREVWGALVPYGMNNLGFGTAKESPWRAGANENTVIKFSHDVSIEGKSLKAGKYGLHMIIHDNDKATLIFSKNHTAWGSYFYESSEDALRVEVNTSTIPHTELLTYDFIAVDGTSATAALKWEKKQIDFKIEMDVTNIVLADIRREMQNQAGFSRQTWEQAANYASNNGGDLNEALGWINNAISGQFYSQQTFANTSIKAGILNKLGRQQEGLDAMDAFLPEASVLEAHSYGRQLINMGKKERALEVFKMNAKKHKGSWPVNYGVARGYSATGNYKSAIKYLKMALKNAPNAGSKGRVQANIEKLEKGEDIN